MSDGPSTLTREESPAVPPGPRVNIREYRLWKLMRQRCENQNNPSYPWYGGKGVKVCERWQDFEAFYADVGPAPTPKHTLDRHPNGEGNYEPGNVRWATRKEQSRNTSTNRLLTCGGVTLCVAEWAERVGISRYVIKRRLALGWDVVTALTKPVDQRLSNGHRKLAPPVVYDRKLGQWTLTHNGQVHLLGKGRATARWKRWQILGVSGGVHTETHRNAT